MKYTAAKPKILEEETTVEQKRSKLADFMEEKFVPLAAKIGSQRHLLALRDGVIMIMPLLILGAFALIVVCFPIPSWIDFMESVGWDEDGEIVGILLGATFGIMALVASFGVASSLAKSYNKKDGTPIDGIPAGVLAIAALFIIVQEDGFGSENLFVAMLVAIATAEVYRLFIQKDWTIKLPDSVPEAISRQFIALFPGLVVLGVAWLAIAVPMYFTDYGTAAAWLNEGLFSFLRNVGGSYPFTLFGTFLEHLLWCFGLHGSAIVIFPFFEPIFLDAIDSGSIITWCFYENGIWIGGSGATLPVVIYMLVFAKSRLLKDVGRIAIGPGLFNINEPVTFGLPVVLNPILMIPFILTPMVLVTIMYFGTAWGIFPILTNLLPWTTPVFISGFLAASGGIGDKLMGVVAQLICFVVAFLIYLPFIRAWDNVNVKREAGESIYN